MAVTEKSNDLFQHLIRLRVQCVCLYFVSKNNIMYDENKNYKYGITKLFLKHLRLTTAVPTQLNGVLRDVFIVKRTQVHSPPPTTVAN